MDDKDTGKRNYMEGHGCRNWNQREVHDVWENLELSQELSMKVPPCILIPAKVNHSVRYAYLLNV